VRKEDIGILSHQHKYGEMTASDFLQIEKPDKRSFAGEFAAKTRRGKDE